MIYKIKNIHFQHICEISPEIHDKGEIKEYLPQTRYENIDNSPMHEHGIGPFCKFKIPAEHRGKSGIYIIFRDKYPVYIGECEDLRNRFNAGYGNISPRNCFIGGQPTNCRINNLILQAIKNGSSIKLFFYGTAERIKIEQNFIGHLSPDWNKISQKNSSYTYPEKKINILKTAKSKEREGKMSKYYKLDEYLRKSPKEEEKLSYNEIERILGFKLPHSAHVHRPWWANSGHTQANAWLNADWKVASVILGTSVTFAKM